MELCSRSVEWVRSSSASSQRRKCRPVDLVSALIAKACESSGPTAELNAAAVNQGVVTAEETDETGPTEELANSSGPKPVRSSRRLSVKLSTIFRLGCGRVRSHLQARFQYVTLFVHRSPILVGVGRLQLKRLIADQAAHCLRFEVERIRRPRRVATTRSVHNELPKAPRPNLFFWTKPVCTLAYRPCGNRLDRFCDRS